MAVQQHPAWTDDDLVFTVETGRPVSDSYVHRHWKAAVQKAGLPYRRIHDLRQTAASLWQEQGEHPKIVQERLGHATISLTLDTYSHVVGTLQRDAADRFEARMRAVREAI